MDTNSQRTSQVLHSPATHYHLGGDSLVEHPTLTELCTLCRRGLYPDNDDLDAVSICGDCKFLLLEDLGTPTRDFDRRRSPRPRRIRHASSESIEELFSQQLSHMINRARQNQSPLTWQDNQLIDDDASGTSLRYTSARTTPNGSRRWRHLLSDTESESFDYLDSLYGESEISISRYRPFNSEIDTISFSAHGGDSDASVDGRVLMDREMLIEPDHGSDVDSDTDIDPMHTGFSQWNSDDLEDDEEEEEEGGWEEADIAEGTHESGEAGVHNFLSSNQSEGNDHVNWYQQPHPFEFESLRNWRIRGGRQAYNHGIFENLVESDFLLHRRNSGDYLDATGFEELLENLAGIDNSRRGAPPAAVSVVKSLPCIIIDEKHEKCDNLACAICKDVLLVGTEVNQLPCLHLYHPSCILRWLRARNSCPLCRYELPTDDKDYDEQKRHIRERLGISDIRQQDVLTDTSADALDRAQTLPAHEIVQVGVEQADVLDMDMDIDSSSIGSEGRSRWFLLAAAPIVGLVGFVLVLWLGKSEKRELISHSFTERGMHQIQVPATSPPNQRDSRGKRWWSIFEWFSS